MASIGLPGILWLPGRCLHPFPSSPFLKHGILSELARGPVTEAVWHAGFQPHHRRDWETAFPSALLCSCLGHAVGQWVGRLWVLLCSELIFILSSSRTTREPNSRATHPLLPFGSDPLCTHLVQDVFLRAQVEVRQDSGQADTGHRQAGLREAHGW